MNFLKIKKIISLVLVISVLAPSLYFYRVEESEALTVVDPVNLVQNAMSGIANTVTSGATQSMWSKEFFLDGIAYAVARMAVRSMVTSTVNWINNGFEGNPAFVTDLGGFMEEVGDNVIGEWILGSKLDFLCSPFKLDVKLALMQDFTRAYEPKCTLSEVTENINGAIDDLDREWNWNTWNSITQNSNNNAYGTYLNASAAIRGDIDKKKAEVGKELDWGSGFKPFKQCQEYETYNENGDSVTEKYCEAVTPGKAIADSLNKSLGAGQDSLIQADEINEIVGALLGQLVKKVIGPEGLLGVSRSSGNQPSLIDQINTEDANISNIATRSIQAIDRDIKTETDYLTAKQATLDIVNSADVKLVNLINCYTGKITELKNNPPQYLLWNHGRQFLSETRALANIDLNQTIIEEKINPKKDVLVTQVESSENIIDSLVSIKYQIETAQSVSELSTAVDSYNNIIANNIIHTTRDIIEAEIETGRLGSSPELIPEMKGIENKADTDIVVCQSFIYTSDPAPLY